MTPELEKFLEMLKDPCGTRMEVRKKISPNPLSELTEFYCELRRWQGTVRGEENLRLRQNIGQVCVAIDRLCDVVAMKEREVDRNGMDAESSKSWAVMLESIEKSFGPETRAVYSRMPCSALIVAVKELTRWQASIPEDSHQGLHLLISRVRSGIDQLFDIDEQEGRQQG